MMDDHNKEKPNILELRSTRPVALEHLDGAWLQVADTDLTRKVMDEEADAQGVARFEGGLLPFCFPNLCWKTRVLRVVPCCCTRVAIYCALPLSESTSSCEWT